MNEAHRMESNSKREVLQQLQSEILRLQGFQPRGSQQAAMGLEFMHHAFPGHRFPTGAIHEFMASCPEDASATGGFVTALAGALMREGGTAIWISPHKKVFPPALKQFGIEPERVLFIQLKKEAELLWATEEALKCAAPAVVIGELPNLGFTASRRLQLAVEQSRVTGFVLRTTTRPPVPTACVSRWKITSLPSETEEGLPGIGAPRWQVELQKIRNGRPGQWAVEWRGGGLYVESAQATPLYVLPGKTA